MRLRKKLDFLAPPGEEEVTYTPLQLSRFDRYVDAKLTNIRRWIVAAVVVILGSGAIFGLVLNSVQEGRAHDQCVASNQGRLAIRNAFDRYTDALGAASNVKKGDPRLEGFRNDFNSRFAKDLPLRDCP